MHLHIERCPNVTDCALTSLAAMRRLRTLWLMDGRITWAGLACLQDMPELEYVSCWKLGGHVPMKAQPAPPPAKKGNP